MRNLIQHHSTILNPGTLALTFINQINTFNCLVIWGFFFVKKKGEFHVLKFYQSFIYFFPFTKGKKKRKKKTWFREKNILKAKFWVPK